MRSEICNPNEAVSGNADCSIPKDLAGALESKFDSRAGKTCPVFLYESQAGDHYRTRKTLIPSE
jgi:hypothetical protein